MYTGRDLIVQADGDFRLYFDLPGIFHCTVSWILCMPRWPAWYITVWAWSNCCYYRIDVRANGRRDKRTEKGTARKTSGAWSHHDEGTQANSLAVMVMGWKKWDWAKKKERKKKRAWVNERVNEWGDFCNNDGQRICWQSVWSHNVKKWVTSSHHLAFRR